MQYGIIEGVVTYNSDAVDPSNPTALEQQDVLDFVASEKAAEQAADTARLAKRPKRSEINGLKAKADNDNSNAETKATVKLLIEMMDNMIAVQGFDVDEDE